MCTGLYFFAVKAKELDQAKSLNQDIMCDNYDNLSQRLYLIALSDSTQNGRITKAIKAHHHVFKDRPWGCDLPPYALSILKLLEVDQKHEPMKANPSLGGAIVGGAAGGMIGGVITGGPIGMAVGGILGSKIGE